MIRGSCLCGGVRFELARAVGPFELCHCSRCRKATGTGHATNLFLQPGLLKWVSGEDQVRSYKVPEAKRFTNFFCATCGSRLPRQGRDPDLVMIPAGSLDDETPIKPQARIFSGSRAGWSCEGDSIPVYSDYPPQ